MFDERVFDEKSCTVQRNGFQLIACNRYWVNGGKCSDMTEKLLNGMLSNNTNKYIDFIN